MQQERNASDTGSRKLTIGIAGGIASGKSLVADMMEQLGARVVDSDRMAHDELARPEVIETYRRWWGDRVVGADGTIQRQRVAEIIFNDTAERARMESFLYPRLERRRRAMMDEAQRDPDVAAIVINSPLLYEVGLDKVCDVVVFVESDRSVRLERVRERRGWTEADFDRREKLQNPLDMKRKAADHTVVNNSSAEALRSQVTRLFSQLTATRS